MLNRIPESNNLMEDLAQCRIYSHSIKKFQDDLEYVEVIKKIFNMYEDNILDLNSQLRVADLGSGCSTFTIALARAFPNWTFDCYELSDSMISIANEQISQNLLTDRIVVVKQDLLTVTGNYDLVLCNRTLHHIEDTKTFWNNIVNLGKRLIVTDAIRPQTIEQINSLAEDAAILFAEQYIDDWANTLKAAYSSDEIDDQIALHNLVKFENTTPEGLTVFAVINTV